MPPYIKISFIAFTKLGGPLLPLPFISLHQMMLSPPLRALRAVKWYSTEQCLSPVFALCQGKRSALPNTHIMLHHPSGAARGVATDIHNEARELMRLRNYVNGVLAQATDQPIEKVRSNQAEHGTVLESTWGWIDVWEQEAWASWSGQHLLRPQWPQ